MRHNKEFWVVNNIIQPSDLTQKLSEEKEYFDQVPITACFHVSGYLSASKGLAGKTDIMDRVQRFSIVGFALYVKFFYPPQANLLDYSTIGGIPLPGSWDKCIISLSIRSYGLVCMRA